jgi:hypothetical protein
MDDSLAAKVGSAFLSLRLQPGREGQVVRLCQLLTGFANPDPTAGRITPNFSNASRSTCARELKCLGVQAGRLAKLATSHPDSIRLARAAKRLRTTVHELHQPGILALADKGFLGGHRIAIRQTANRIAEARSCQSGEDIRLLEFAAECAKRSAVGPVANSSNRGRPANERIRILLRVLHRQYQELTGKRPTITVRPDYPGSPASGRFVELVRQVFSALAISASAEAAVRAEFTRSEESGSRG